MGASEIDLGTLIFDLSDLVSLGELAMGVHHAQQALDIFELFVCRYFLVLVQLSDFAISDLLQDLLWRLRLQHYRRPGVVDSTDLEIIRLQL